MAAHVAAGVPAWPRGFVGRARVGRSLNLPPTLPKGDGRTRRLPRRAALALARIVKNHPSQPERIGTMLYTLALILLVLWVLGLVSSYTLGGFIHILLVVAIVVVVIRLIQGRRVL
jgi:hypothetical protein